MRTILFLLLAGFTMAAEPLPNILLIMADDLGYGDVSCYGAGKLATPNMDRLAREGLKFTDGHATSATCTPSRYALLTGRYPWRKKGTGILPGDAGLIIPTDIPTLPKVMKQAGYVTGVVGKWHLGLGGGAVDWNGVIKPSPNEIGFDHSFIMAATGDRVPTVFVRDGRVANLDLTDPIEVSYKQPFAGLPTGKSNPELLRMGLTHGHDQAIVDGISRIGYMSGGKAALWHDEDLGDTFKNEALKFLEKHAAKPFFLYYASHEPHVPRVPHPRFIGKSGMGPRGDAILQLDAAVGEVLDKLDELKLAGKTLVILTSDNGPVLDDGYADQAKEKLGDHTPSGPLRGNKYSSFEAGTRVPFLVRWPGQITPGTSEALICQMDFLSSFAALTKQAIPPATDSENLLAALQGKTKQGRETLVEQGGPLALRQGNWKLIPANQASVKRTAFTNVEVGGGREPQLYDLSKDLGEKENLASKHPEKVAEMTKLLEATQAARTD
jgi:arylsulfatase A-like enzyme